MERFPPIQFGELIVRLPLAAGTATALAAAIIDPTPERVLQIEQHFKCDAALAIWALRSAELHCAGRPKTPGELARWTVEHASAAFASADAAEHGALDLERVKRVAIRSASVAACCADEGAAEEPERTQLLLAALLHNAPQWLALSASDSDVDSSDDVARQWYRAAFGTTHRARVETAVVKLESKGFEHWPSSVHQARLAAERLWSADSTPVFPIGAVVALKANFDVTLEQRKLEALAEFAAGAGHEINNPLAVISGRAQLLLRGESDPDRRQDLAMMHAQARRVHEMIAGLMLFARPPVPSLVVVDMVELVREVVDQFTRNTPGEVAIALRLPDQPISVQADLAQIKLALTALLDNAQEAARPGTTPSITVSAECVELDRGRAIRIAVRDEGMGISDEARSHLFDPFYSGRQAGRGLGVGLAKCWRIVTNHGGRIEASDEPAGATFTIVLTVDASSPGD